ncbi:MAG: NAD-dependent epimerase/dehydratase family protein [Rhizobiales bacterium]|nr:NAD-dependent epimerase/dehydratase family protein [Hyphomicrobiales bacterium]
MNLFIFGLGYSCRHFLDRFTGDYANISATVRDPSRHTARSDCEILSFGPDRADPLIAARLAQADLLLVSVPPSGSGDPVLTVFGDAIKTSRIRRIVYLSTVGVYGDHDGQWIDETAPVAPSPGRRAARATAEGDWMTRAGERTSILRLAGIYGPARNALTNLRAGTARRIVKPGQVFNRIHVADIARAIAAAFVHETTGIWNVCDDEPAPPQDVVTFASELMGIAPPPEIDFASAGLSDMARSFYATNNRIANARMKRELEVELAYPTYREGLRALWAAGEGAG